MTSVTLAEDEAKIVRLALALLYRSILNDENVCLPTLLDAWKDAELKDDDRLDMIKPDVLLRLIKQFRPPVKPPPDLGNYPELRKQILERIRADREKAQWQKEEQEGTGTGAGPWSATEPPADGREDEELRPGDAPPGDVRQAPDP